MAGFRAAAVLVVLSGIVAEGSRSSECPDHDSSKCMAPEEDCCTDSWSWNKNCEGGYRVVSTSVGCGGDQVKFSCVHEWSDCHEWDDWAHNNCEVTQEEEEDWWAKMMTGTIVGTVLGIILIILASMPVCCGVMKENKGALMGIGVCVGLFAAFSFFIPLIAALAATNEAVDNHCDKCGCTEEQREDAQAIFGFWGAIIGYLHGFGWLCVALGITAEVLVCCMCCACCGPLKTYREEQKMQQAGQPQVAQVPGVVVGAPAPGQPC